MAGDLIQEQDHWVTVVLGVAVSRGQSDDAGAGAVTSEAAAVAAELGFLVQRIVEVSGPDVGLRGALAKQAADVRAALKAGDPAEAGALLQTLRAAVDAAADRAAALVPALAEWKSARQTALQSLNAIIARVDTMSFVDAPKASVLLRAIAANLTVEPATRQQVLELRRYLEDDENVGEAEEPNGFGIKLDLTRPLVAALGKLNACLPG